LHALLCLLIHIDGPITIERIATAGQLLDEVRALDAARVEVRRRHAAAIEASKTTVTEVFGIGPLTAAIIVGRVGDVRRFPSAGHFARHNETAPIEASSGPTKRHRLNPRGDRQLNHAIHMAAVTQVRNKTPGRAYYRYRRLSAVRAGPPAGGTQSATAAGGGALALYRGVAWLQHQGDEDYGMRPGFLERPADSLRA
jgi:transposase